MKPLPLTAADLDARMASLPAWTRTERALLRTFRFASFADAIAFMVRGAFSAEVLDHHPEWKNVYDRVWVELTSHDADGITTRDFALAAELDAHFAHFRSATVQAP